MLHIFGLLITTIVTEGSLDNIKALWNARKGA